MAVRAVRPAAAAARRARPGAEAARRPSSTRTCRTGSASRGRARPRCSACSARRASGCTCGRARPDARRADPGRTSWTPAGGPEAEGLVDRDHGPVAVGVLGADPPHLRHGRRELTEYGHLHPGAQPVPAVLGEYQRPGLVSALGLRQGICRSLKATSRPPSGRRPRARCVPGRRARPRTPGSGRRPTAPPPREAPWGASVVIRRSSSARSSSSRRASGRARAPARSRRPPTSPPPPGRRAAARPPAAPGRAGFPPGRTSTRPEGEAARRRVRTRLLHLRDQLGAPAARASRTPSASSTTRDRPADDAGMDREVERCRRSGCPWSAGSPAARRPLRRRRPPRGGCRPGSRRGRPAGDRAPRGRHGPGRLVRPLRRAGSPPRPRTRPGRGRRRGRVPEGSSRGEVPLPSPTVRRNRLSRFRARSSP